MKPESSTWNVRDIGAAAFAIGLFSGAVFAASDLLMNRATASTAQCAQLILVMSAVGALLAAPVLTLFILIGRRFPFLPAEPALLAFSAGLGIQCGFLYALGLRHLLFTAVVPWPLALAAYHLLRGTGSSRLLSRATAFSLYTALAVPLLLSFGGLRGGKGWVLLILLLLTAPAILLPWLAARFRVAVLVMLLVGITVGQVTGKKSRAWKRQSISVTGVESTTNNDATGTGQASGDAAPAKQPNVVLIVLDTTRADRLGCYGHTGNLTPRLDAFAAESTLYEQAVSSAPWTVPSHASLFTGWYTVTHGCDAEPHRWLDGGFVTLAEMLHARGYETAGLVANGYVYGCNLLQGVEEYLELDQSAGHRGTKMYNWLSKAGAPRAWADQGAHESVISLSQWLARRNEPARPFYLFVNLMEAHWPLLPPYEQRQRLLMPGMGYLEATRIAGQFYGPKWTAGERHSERAAEAVRRLYNAEVAYQDSQLGGLLDVLRRQTDLDNTLVIVTADHGEHQGEHGHWDHVFSVGEALIHVPLLIRYPSVFPAGRRIPGQCQLVDMVPTVFDVLGMPCPVPGLPGRTLVPQRFEPRAYAYSEVYPYYGHLERLSEVTGLKRDIAEFLGYLRSVRTDQYKFVWSDRGRRSLYDIAADPQEAHDLIDEFPEIAKKLETHMAEWWNAQPRYEPRETTESTPTGEDTLRGLRGLGYVK